MYDEMHITLRQTDISISTHTWIPAIIKQPSPLTLPPHPLLQLWSACISVLQRKLFSLRCLSLLFFFSSSWPFPLLYQHCLPCSCSNGLSSLYSLHSSIRSKSILRFSVLFLSSWQTDSNHIVYISGIVFLCMMYTIVVIELVFAYSCICAVLWR